MPEVRLIRVPPGYETTEDGYFLDIEALTDLTTASVTYRKERDAWVDSYYALADRARKHGNDLESQIVGLKIELARERTDWQEWGDAKDRAHKIELATVKAKAKMPGFGAYAGLGYDPFGGGWRFSVGMGLIWKVW
jgi:hypothetical protein